eukprot:CAMPEP_0185689178 /NCGR_PEP_ID=MMETSP1164-20130828/309_1 /TAXON_ID=1104430 /ORGANISM="Chrysoreinhardia sp, Strain CCMP2950" /LENGTH=67 /DNA_ID=CAMNT_0028355665 /DNA_START=39 /DNA_END=238 /DNA_ORIENTATION=-
MCILRRDERGVIHTRHNAGGPPAHPPVDINPVEGGPCRRRGAFILCDAGVALDGREEGAQADDGRGR